jgi:NAD-dependent DNA ligase
MTTIAVAERRRIVIGNEAMSPKDKINEFLGFCAGVICDGVVSDTEAKSIIERFSREPVLSEHPHLLQLQGTLRSAVADGVLTSEEADDIKAWIARIVSDGYSETGLASFGATPSMPDMIEDHSEIEFPERVFVVTGTLRIGPRREVAHMIEALDGIFANAVTRQTHYVVLASVASRDWKQSHFGTKIERAQALVAEGSTLRFVSEPAFESALRLRTGR